MASFAELHESWTHVQFLDFMRAAMMAGLPDDVEDPVSWQESRNRWEFLPDTLAMFAGTSFFLPLVLEGEPLFDYFPPRSSSRGSESSCATGLKAGRSRPWCVSAAAGNVRFWSNFENRP
ncbi:MAG: hypothetical protein ACREJ5_13685 [Geminicoccaceae bacterium]